MNNTIRVFRRALLLGILSVMCATADADPFVNLDFEGDASQPGYVPFPNDPLFFEDFLDWAQQANPVDPSYGQLYLTYFSNQGSFPLLWNVPGQPTADNPLPGWTAISVTHGGVPGPSHIFLNDYWLAPTACLVVVQDPFKPSYPMPDPISGRNSLWMWSGGGVPSQGPLPPGDGPPYYLVNNGLVSIAQTGDVPAAAQSLRFRFQTVVGGGYGDEPAVLHVSLGGISIPLYELEPGVLGGDISALAGLTDQELEIVCQSVLYNEDPWTVGWQAMIDDIEFSPLPIPEPATVSLLALGLLLGWRRRYQN